MCILFFETFKIGHFQHIKSQHLLLFESFSILVCIKTTFENENHLCFSCLWKSNKRNTSRKQHLSQRTKMGSWLCKSWMDALQGRGCHWFPGWVMAQRRQRHLPLVLLSSSSMGTHPQHPPSPAPSPWLAFHTGIKPQLEAIISCTLGEPTEAVITW